MNGQPDPLWLDMLAATGCATAAHVCGKLQNAVEANRILPLHARLKGDRGVGLFHTTWPFRDKHQVQFVQRSLLHALLWMVKWILGLVAALTVVVTFSSLIREQIQPVDASSPAEASARSK